MNEVLTLLAVLVLIYFLECLSLVPEENFVFRVRWLRRWTPGKSLFRLHHSRSGIYLSNLLPGLGDIAICAGSAPTDGDKGSVELGKDAEQKFRKMLDTKAVRRRIRGYRRVLRTLYWDSYLLLVVIFVLFPLVALRFGLWIALPLVAVFALGVVHMVCAFRQVHRAFEPDAVRERREKTVGLLLSPLGAIRAPALLLRSSTAGFHPLAIAAATMPAAQARQIASQILRQLRFAAPASEQELFDPRLRSAPGEWLSVVWKWAAEEFGDPEALLGAPAKRFPDSNSYCPRCEQEYVLSEGECSDCPGMSLELFPAATAPAPAHTQQRPTPR